MVEMVFIGDGDFDHGTFNCGIKIIVFKVVV